MVQLSSIMQQRSPSITHCIELSSMNLPSDPKERLRLTASILQKKYGGSQGFHLPNIIAQEEDDDDHEPSKRQYCTTKDQKRSVIGNANNDLGLGITSNLQASQQRLSKQNNQYMGHLKFNRPANRDKRKRDQGIIETNIGRFGNSVIEQARARNFLSRGRANLGKVAPLCAAEDDADLLTEVKKRLSLPTDTLLPDGFLNRLNAKLINSVNNQLPESLSRTTRRQSLYDIGFGKLSTYTKLHALGSGTYSIVYKGSSRLTNRLVALKEIHLEREEGVPFTAIREISLLKQLKHCNIITLHDLIYADRTLTLVFEFVDRDLSHYMDECDHKINLNNIRLFLFQLLRGLKYCHDRKVLHRDLKPQNILISNQGELKLADFGLARARTFPTKTYTDEVVTLWYRPPDILLGNVNYGVDIDMWGVGCIFFEMAAGFTLFLGVDNKKQIACIFEILGTPNELEWPNISQDLKDCEIDISQYQGRDFASIATRLDETGIDLLEGFLKCNPNLRVTSHEALQHKYFSSLPPEIYALEDSESILSLPGLRLFPEEFARRSSPLHNVHV